jgi:hypothetical protein
MPRRSRVDAHRVLVILGRSREQLPIMLDCTLDLRIPKPSNPSCEKKNRVCWKRCRNLHERLIFFQLPSCLYAKAATLPQRTMPVCQR